MSENNKPNDLVEKCFRNIELVTNICQFLNYKDEYQLQMVSRELNDIIINFVWNKRFKEIKILQNEDEFIVSNIFECTNGENNKKKQTTTVQFFKKHEMANFFNLNKCNIKKLQLDATERVRFPIKHKLTNLTHIELSSIILTNKDIEMLANNSKELESLLLKACFNKDNKSLLIGKDIDIEIIKSMQKLKKLYFGGHVSEDRRYTFTDVINILNELELQDITLFFIIYPDSESYKNKNELNLSNFQSYKRLTMGSFSKGIDCINFQRYFLPKFVNLSELCLSGASSVSITNEFFQNLLKFCRNLTTLLLHDFEINEFIAMPKLHRLQFYFCTGLTFKMLKTILNEMQLESFSSSYTLYKGDFQTFFISSSLKKIKFERSERDLEGNIMKLLDYNHKNLKQLTKFYWKEDNKINFLNALTHCKILTIQFNALYINDYIKLKYLEKLNLYNTLSDVSIDFSHILLLLQLENIKELSIDPCMHSTLNVELSEVVAFQTKLHYLNIGWDIMKIALEFFLDLLKLNRNLCFKCLLIDTFDNIIKITRNDKFPQRIKYAKVWGYQIDLPNIKLLLEKLVQMYGSMFELVLE